MYAGRTGRGCFEENVKLFADPQTEQEKYNLYMGLAVMAGALESLIHEVYSIRQQLNNLSR